MGEQEKDKERREKDTKRVRGIEKVKERKEVGNGWKGEGARVWVKIEGLLGIRERRDSEEKVKRQERSSGRLKYLCTCESSGIHIIS